MASWACTDHIYTLSEILVLIVTRSYIVLKAGAQAECCNFFAQTFRPFPESRGQRLLLNQDNHATVALICFLENAAFKPGQ